MQVTVVAAAARTEQTAEGVGGGRSGEGAKMVKGWVGKRSGEEARVVEGGRKEGRLEKGEVRWERKGGRKE